MNQRQQPNLRRHIACSKIFLQPICAALLTASAAFAAGPVDGQFPPQKPAEGKWENLFSGGLEDNWTSMSISVKAPFITTSPNTNRPGEYVLNIGRGPTGVIRSVKVYENFILEYEWRHLTEAPNANGGKGTSGNSGVLVRHSAFPSFGGPFPHEGFEIQVCNLGNGSWYTSHGDIFTLPGSISKAITDPRFASSYSCGIRSMPIAFNGSKTAEWNHIRLTCMDGMIQNEVNGTLVTTLHRVSPRKGYMSIESEGAPVEFRAMRIQELPPDPELAPKHLVPLLPELMSTDYISERKAIELPAGNFIASADARETFSLPALVTGLGLPEARVTGRVVVNVRDGKVSVTAQDKTVVPAQPVTTGTKGVLHLETGKFAHVLIFKPVKK